VEDEDGYKVWLVLTSARGVETGRTCIDKNDLPTVRAHRWGRTVTDGHAFAASNSAPGKFLHRFLLDVVSEHRVHHIDEDRLNNCRANLKLLAPGEGIRAEVQECSFPGCSKVALATFPLCKAHQKQKRKGTPLRPLGWRRGPNTVRVEGDTAYLALTDMQGEIQAEALIDVEDIEKVRTRRWGLQGKKRKYVRSQRPVGIYLHCFLMPTPPAGFELDHIDGDPLNNRKGNLRLVTRAQNSQNVVRSEVRNVFFLKDGRRKPWFAKVKKAGVQTRGPSRATEEEAEMMPRS